MSEVTRTLDQLTHAHEGGAWHGPALREVLQGVTAEMAALRRLVDGNRALRATIAGFDEPRLDASAAGSAQTASVLMHGAIAHDLYHAGQIALLRKARVR